MCYKDNEFALCWSIYTYMYIWENTFIFILLWDKVEEIQNFKLVSYA